MPNPAATIKIEPATIAISLFERPRAGGLIVAIGEDGSAAELNNGLDELTTRQVKEVLNRT